jgi:two-component system nitrogen regulation response regulator NtrX
VYSLIEKVGPTESSILIMGENGSGKELVAQAIHQCSARKDRPLVKMNCAAVPDNLLESELFGHTKGAFTGAYFAKKGRIQAAHGGTLLLDEIGDMSPSAQAKVLRFLESGEIQQVGSTEIATVNVRVVAATNKDILKMVEEKVFREDLFYRLNVFSITVPPLRDRKEDIPLLLDYFIEKCSDANGVNRPKLSPSALNYLRGFDWPGNVRQLRNFVERLMVMKEGDLIELSAVRQLLSPRDKQSNAPDSIRSLHNARQEFERDYILSVLECNEWRVAKVAEILGVDRVNLYRKMRQLGISGK